MIVHEADLVVGIGRHEGRLELSAAVSAHRALGFECIAVPNALTAAAPMSVRLLFSQVKLTRQRSHPEFLHWRCRGCKDHPGRIKPMAGNFPVRGRRAWLVGWEIGIERHHELNVWLDKDCSV